MDIDSILETSDVGFNLEASVFELTDLPFFLSNNVNLGLNLNNFGVHDSFLSIKIICEFGLKFLDQFHGSPKLGTFAIGAVGFQAGNSCEDL